MSELLECTCIEAYKSRKMRDPNCCACSCDHNDLVGQLEKANERVAKLESENTNGNAAAELLIWWAQKLSNAPNEDLKEVIRIGYKRIVNLANLIGEEQLRKEQE